MLRSFDRLGSHGEGGFTRDTCWRCSSPGTFGSERSNSVRREESSVRSGEAPRREAQPGAHASSRARKVTERQRWKFDGMTSPRNINDR